MDDVADDRSPASEALDGAFQTQGQRQEHTAPGERFVVLAAREARRGRGGDLLNEIDVLMQRARHAPGFGRIDVLQPFGEPEVYLHYEVWDGKPAHDAFDAGPMHGTFAERAAGLVAHHNIPLHYRLNRSYGPAHAAPPQEPGVEHAPRLPLTDPDQSSARVRDIFAGLPGRLGIFRAAANAESLFPHLMETARAILGTDMALPLRTRELVILQVGQLSGSAYELAQHAPLSLQAGVTQAQLGALGRGDDETGFDAADRTVLRFAREALVLADVSDEAWDAAAALHTPRALTELLVIVGFYRLMCTVMRSARLPTDPAINAPWPTSREHGAASNPEEQS